MKTAFFCTDCSVGSALALRRWLETKADNAIRLTVVYPYDIDNGSVISRVSFGTAKQLATSRLVAWLDLLPPLGAGEYKPETLLASPELAIRMHLLLRPYDYLILDEQAFRFVSNTTQFARKNSAALCRLSVHNSTLQTA